MSFLLSIPILGLLFVPGKKYFTAVLVEHIIVVNDYLAVADIECSRRIERRETNLRPGQKTSG